jgi:hypothetical protein
MFLSVIIGSLYSGVQAGQCQPTVTMSPEMTAVLVTALSSVVGACVVNPENPNIARGFCVGAFSAIFGAFASVFSWDASCSDTTREYCGRMMHTFTTLVAPSFLIATLTCDDAFWKVLG